jgi:SPX domain protein involved in polyphosphate accumulation
MSLLVEEKVAEPQLKKSSAPREAAKQEKAAPLPEAHRFERKFFISGLTRQEILALVKLHPAMFAEIYHERAINNIYFDTPTLQYIYATVDGLGQRQKCRIRWYGDLLGHIEKPVLELKIKEGFVGRKESYPLAPFALDENFHFGAANEIFKKSDLPARLKMELFAVQPTLLNRYRRRYFQSANRHYRITIDSDLEYCCLKARGNTFLHRIIDRNNVIVELKYGNEKDFHADSISRHFPFRVTKSSKYISGVDMLYFQ